MSDKPKPEIPEKKRQLPVKMPDSVLPGVYSNQMMVSHTREEFMMDFMNFLIAPEHILTARLLIPPVLMTWRFIRT